MKTAKVGDVSVEIGDYVGFKCDIEQSGKIVDIKRQNGQTILVLESKSGFSGEYIGGETRTSELASDCWVE